MKYEKLMIIVEKYTNEYESDVVYFDTINYLKNKDLQRINEEDIKNSISPFFKEWMKARRVSWSDPKIIRRVLKKINESASHFELLKDKRLETTKLDDEINMHIKTIFNNIKEIDITSKKPRILGPVGAAKIIHIILPDFFPLWDRRIREAYECNSKDNTNDFIEFMRIMQKELKELLESCDNSKEGFDRDKSWLKLIDEYNFMLSQPGYMKIIRELEGQ